jgi:hypothetical protein
LRASAAEEPGTSSEGATSLSTAFRAAANLQQQQQQQLQQQHQQHQQGGRQPVVKSKVRTLAHQGTAAKARSPCLQAALVDIQPQNLRTDLIHSQLPFAHSTACPLSPACAGLHVCMQQQVVFVCCCVHPLAQRCSSVSHVSSQAGNIRRGLQEGEGLVRRKVAKECSKSAAL